jgi:hypothetical protein
MISSRSARQYEEARLLIVLFDEAVDGGLQVDDGVEDAVLKATTGKLGEEASIALSHEHDVSTKWKVQRG